MWLAGMGGTNDADGKPIGDFAGQTRQAFRNIEATLKRAGGTHKGADARLRGLMPTSSP